MDWIEVTAKTVDDAKELALDRLGVVEDELEFEVLDEARKGMLGIGRSDARIRARVKPLSREKPTDRRRRRKSSERPRGSRGGREGGERTTPDRKPSSGGPAPGSGKPGEEGERDQTSRPGGSSGGASRRRRGGRGRSRNGAPGEARPASESAKSGAANGRSSQPEVEVESIPVAEQAEHAATFTAQLVQSMGFPASVRTEIDEDDVTVHVDGDDLGPLVGPRGATLQALEEVVKAAVQHHAGGHSAWVHVDVGGYRERRRAALAEFARKVAGEVTESGSARSLEPMTAADRKVVHDTLSEVDGVSTSSEGEDPRRRVVIHPA